jgi:hypothetical protein
MCDILAQALELTGQTPLSVRELITQESNLFVILLLSDIFSLLIISMHYLICAGYK